MEVTALSRNQLSELKQSYLFDHVVQGEGRLPYCGELADADETIPDEVIFAVYAGVLFTPDDFFCTAGKEDL